MENDEKVTKDILSKKKNMFKLLGDKFEFIVMNEGIKTVWGWNEKSNIANNFWLISSSSSINENFLRVISVVCGARWGKRTVDFI